MAKLIDLELPASEYILDKSPMTFGRAEEEGLSLNDINLPTLADSSDKMHREKLKGVSREGYITFTQKEGAWYLTPRADRNVYISGREIIGETRLKDGMEISVGMFRYRLKFSLE